MNDVEAALAALLVERAERIAPARGHRETTLRTARRRRARNGAVAACACVAVIAAAFGVVRAVDEREPARPAGEASGETSATAGTYGFWSTTAAEYPYVATGYFRAATWELRAAAVSLEPASDVRLTFRVVRGGAGSVSGSVTMPPAPDALHVEYQFGDWAPKADVAALFGTAPPETETVQLALRSGETIEAHVFGGYDNKTAHALDYFVVFLPEDVSGEVVARGRHGDVVATRVIPLP